MPVGDRLLGLAEPLLAALDPRALRLEQRLRARDLGLAGGELAAEIVEPACLVLEVRGGLALGLLAAQLRLAPVQLGLAGGQLALLGGDLGALGAHRGDDLAGARALLGKPLEVGGEPVCLRLQLGLARLEVLLARGHGGARLDSSRSRSATSRSRSASSASWSRSIVSRVASTDSRASTRAAASCGVAFDLGERALERPLALGERGFLLGELRGGLGALAVGVRAARGTWSRSASRARLCASRRRRARTSARRAAAAPPRPPRRAAPARARAPRARPAGRPASRRAGRPPPSGATWPVRRRTSCSSASSAARPARRALPARVRRASASSAAERSASSASAKSGRARLLRPPAAAPACRALPRLRSAVGSSASRRFSSCARRPVPKPCSVSCSSSAAIRTAS